MRAELQARPPGPECPRARDCGGRERVSGDLRDLRGACLFEGARYTAAGLEPRRHFVYPNAPALAQRLLATSASLACDRPMDECLKIAALWLWLVIDAAAALADSRVQLGLPDESKNWLDGCEVSALSDVWA